MNLQVNILGFFLIIIIVVPLVSAAHFIVGRVNDAFDGEAADDHTVVLWNPSNGENDNVTDVIGQNGNSNTPNTYLIDCELLNMSCAVGDEIRVRVINTGDGYSTDFVNVSVTGAGFDVMPNLTLNSRPLVVNLTVDDALLSPIGEIDLIPNATRIVTCTGVILDYDGDSGIVNASAEFFDNSVSFYGDLDDNNSHYTNSSCFLNSSYGNDNESTFSCGFDVQYYANSDTWNCTVRAFDSLVNSGIGSNSSIINPLLAVGLPETIDYGEVNANSVSDENVTNVTNFGNVQINLTLEGYAVTEGDNVSMGCSFGENQNISIEYEKFNLTSSNLGDLNLTQFEGLYENLTSESRVRRFELAHRQSEIVNEATRETYWRIYVPLGVAGNCTGNIIFGAIQSSES